MDNGNIEALPDLDDPAFWEQYNRYIRSTYPFDIEKAAEFLDNLEANPPELQPMAA